MSQADIDIIDGAFDGNCAEIVKSIWHFADDLKRNPTAGFAQMDDPLKERGATLERCLSIVTDRNFREGMIVLFSQKRAQHILSNEIPHGKKSRKGREFLETLVELFDKDFNQVNKKLNDFLSPPTNGNYWVDPSKLDEVVHYVLTASVAYRQREKLTSEVQKSVDGKTMAGKKKM